MTYLTLLILMVSSLSFAGGGTIAVHDGPPPACVKSEPEFPVVVLTSTEAIQSMQQWLKGEPQTRPFLEKAFTGLIRFCSEKERESYFSAMIEGLKKPQKNLKLYVLMLVHARSDVLANRVKAKFEANTAKGTFRFNLQAADRLIAHQRKSPAPYPTEKVVRRLMKELEL